MCAVSGVYLCSPVQYAFAFERGESPHTLGHRGNPPHATWASFCGHYLRASRVLTASWTEACRGLVRGAGLGPAPATPAPAGAAPRVGWVGRVRRVRRVGFVRRFRRVSQTIRECSGQKTYYKIAPQATLRPTAVHCVAEKEAKNADFDAAAPQAPQAPAAPSSSCFKNTQLLHNFKIGCI